MADIYDLVQRALSRNRQGASQFHDPTSEIMMELPKMIESEKNKQNVANNDALQNITSLIDKVHTPEGMANISSSLDKLSKQSGGNIELDSSIAILQGINKTSQQNYSAYARGIDRGLEYIDSDAFPQEAKDYENLGAIASNAGFVNEDGTGDMYKYLYAEKEKINSYMDTIGLGFDGKNKRFNYGKGTDTSVIRKLREHNNRINIAIQTLGEDGRITKAEAQHIMNGDSEYYEKDKERALSEAETIIKLGLKSTASLDILIGKAINKTLTDADLTSLDEDYNIAGKELVGAIGGHETIIANLKSIRTTSNNRARAANQKYKDWIGRDYDFTLGYEAAFSEDDGAIDTGETLESGTYEEQIKSDEEIAEARYAPLSQTKESKGLVEEASTSPVFKKKIEKVNSMRNTSNNLKNVGTPSNMTEDGLTLKSSRKNKTDFEKALGLDIGETISIDKLYEYKNTIIPNLRKEQSSLKSRQKYLRDLYPTFTRENLPENIKKELSDISNKLKNLNQKLNASSVLYRTDLNSIVNKSIKQYEDSEHKLKQAEKDLDNFKKTYKAK